MVELEDDGCYYDNVDGLGSQQRFQRVLYPPRLMVDFKSLGVEALKRYRKFYHLKMNENLEKEDLAALVARHFDMSLEVEEDDSIVAFMQRLRNGERTAVKRSTAREKECKAQAAAEKAKRKSTSRKRQRDHSVSVPSGRNVSNNSSHNTSNGNAGNSHGIGNNHSRGASNSHNSRNHGNEGRKAPSSSSKHSNASGSKTKKTKKDADTGEDNELYCICNLPSYGNMIACDGKSCPNPSQWYHLECVGLADGRHPDTWLCPECDPKGFTGGSSNSQKKKKNKRSKSPGNK
ncbi:hypothetical protein KXD40_007546 [Peronospora effusa]|uniref:PHD-type domain-containing protein n=2 Tax=Peronospora TaxID=70742 RepID=A0A3M6V9J3_9STRA|nr:hypothetical protein DD238_007781 [Peronospora effusa]CAH0486487.1 unnamed protein product [Peronospora farinosa]RQM11822.1 hypothetical protein DD237_008116 [Peronospora effusa]UIZ29161.1 hypothetical protein KXD40_007546 [Peronospora effusa]CAI5704054.1 unnamed protein product [Peronospora effusa]